MKSKELDQFYTNPIIASRFVNKIKTFYSLDDYDNVIEPSAGSGNILELLPEHNRIGLDIDPKHPEVLPGDFFDYSTPKGSTIAIGNPPFGRKGSLAVDFINKCSQYADAIAFILPRGFMRVLTHKNLNPELGLYWSCILPDDSFIHNDRPYTVKCCAQLWAKSPPNMGIGGYESWADTSMDTLNRIDQYYNENKCYEKPTTLF